MVRLEQVLLRLSALEVDHVAAEDRDEPPTSAREGLLALKQFSCGDAVPGCSRYFRGSEQQILVEEGDRARADHGLSEVSPAIAAQVQQHTTLAA